MCMGVGNSMEMGIIWESHGNGNSHMANNGNRNGNGNNAVGMGVTYC